MLRRKFQEVVEQHFKSGSDKILIVEGARQIGKSYIVRHVGRTMFANFVEINLAEDKDGRRVFENVRTVEEMYMQVSVIAKGRLGNRDNTLVFLDEIQEYPHLLTMLKFLRQDGRYTFVASGSLLGVALTRTTSVPVGSIVIERMYALDFEEFLWANGITGEIIGMMRDSFRQRQSLGEALHATVMDLFRRYLLVGGLPDAVNEYVGTRNMYNVRKIQENVHALYAVDASKYDAANRLKTRRIYDLVPSMLENKKKRVVMKDIEQKAQARYSTYADEFEYLIGSGTALEVRAISNPRFPLVESGAKNLLKLYMNDVGMLTQILYRDNLNAILADVRSINLGSVYECVVATELRAHGHTLYYYDNKANGEVDYLVDDYDRLSVLPIEVKSGKDYKTHSALDHFVSTPDYNIAQAVVLSNERQVQARGKILYLPIYYVMFV